MADNFYRVYVQGKQVGAYTDRDTAYQEGWKLYNAGNTDTYLTTPEGWLYTFSKHPDENPNPPQPQPTTSRGTIRLGDKGNDVIYLQQSLLKLGYSPGPADGIFGNLTLTAVKKFQQANGLTVDGIVGPRTWQSIELQLSNTPTSNTHPHSKPESNASTSHRNEAYFHYRTIYTRSSFEPLP